MYNNFMRQQRYGKLAIYSNNNYNNNYKNKINNNKKKIKIL